jgi:hypothetical protein
VHGRNCTCEEEDCLKGHPLRAGRDRQRPQASLPATTLTPLTGGGAATGVGLSSAAARPTQQQRTPYRRQPPPGYMCAPSRPTSRAHHLHVVRPCALTRPPRALTVRTDRKSINRSAHPRLARLPSPPALVTHPDSRAHGATWLSCFGRVGAPSAARRTTT